MGEAKRNPVAIAAKQRKIKPKRKNLSKTERKKILDQAIYNIVYSPFIPYLNYYK